MYRYICIYICIYIYVYIYIYVCVIIYVRRAGVRFVGDFVNAHNMPYAKCWHMQSHMYVVIAVLVSYVPEMYSFFA